MAPSFKTALEDDGILRTPPTKTVHTTSSPKNPNHASIEHIPPFALLERTSREALVTTAMQQCQVDAPQIEDIYPCTPLQQGFVAISSKKPGAHTLVYSFDLPVDIDLARFHSAWANTLGANPILRTRIIQAPDARLYQVVVKHHKIQWDTREAADAIPADWLQWDLAQPMVRFALSGRRPYCFTLVISHALIDGWSRPLLLQQVNAAYHGGQLLRRPFNSFIAHLHNQDQAAMDRFWRAQFQRLEAVPFPRLPSPDHVVHPAANIKCTIPMTDATLIAYRIQLAWAVVIALHTQTHDVVFGMTVRGRRGAMPGIKETTGPAIATVPVRFRIEPAETVEDAIRRLRTLSGEATPFEQAGLQRISRLSPDAASACRFQSLLVVQPPRENIPPMFQHGGEMALPATYGSYALTLDCWLKPHSIEAVAKYDAGVIDAVQTERLLHQLRHILRRLEHAPTTPISDLDLASPEDRSQLQTWNADLSDPADSCAHEVIAQRCSQQPHAPAVCAWDAQLTYRELDIRAADLAHRLVLNGIGPEVFVPLYFEKSCWMPVAMLAVLKAGGAFVLMDPAHPIERLRGICAETQAPVVVTSAANEAQAACLGPQVMVFAGSGETSTLVSSHPSLCSHMSPGNDTNTGKGINSSDNINPSNGTPPHNAMYAVFTSGSTGKPKGVVIEHRHFLSGIDDKIAALGLNRESRFLQFSSYAFDASITELLTTLIAGGCVCIPMQNQHQGDLGQAATRMHANIASLTPVLARALNPAHFPTVQTLKLGGDSVSSEELARWHEKDLRVSYGPAECAVTTAGGRIPPDQSQSGYIGFPVAARFWVTHPDNYQTLLPVGVVGELLIESYRVGRGYLNEPAKTAAAFIDPPGWRKQMGTLAAPFYRTGDLVKYMSDGSLVFVGRKDGQVKVRGVRIELAEVESHARRCFGGVDVVAGTISLPGAGASSRALVGFVVSGSEEQSDAILRPPTDAFRALVRSAESHLRELVPQYMIPSVFFPVSHVPLTSSAKVDRMRLEAAASLLSPDEIEAYRAEAMGMQYQAPSSEMEERLVQVWGEALQRDPHTIGVHENFFALGGDSISAMQVVSRCYDDGMDLTVSEIFRCKTIARLSSECCANPSPPVSPDNYCPGSLLDADDVQAFASSSLALPAPYTPADVDDILPTTEMQTTLIHTGYVAYFWLHFPGAVDLARLDLACRTIIDHRPILRTFMTRHDDQYLQIVLHRLECPLVHLDCEQNIEDLTQSLSQDSTGLSYLNKPLTQFYLVRDTTTHHRRLIIRIPHALYDSHVVGRIFKDISLAYHETTSFPHRGPSFAEFAQYKKRALTPETRLFWQDFLRGAQMTNIQSPRCGPPGRVVRRLLTLPSTRDGVALAFLLQAAWVCVLAQVTQQRDVVFGLVRSGRDVSFPGIEHVTGPCITMLPTRVAIDATWTVRQLVQVLQEQYTRATPHSAPDWRDIASSIPGWEADLVYGSSFNHTTDSVAKPPQLDGVQSERGAQVVQLDVRERLAAQLNLSTRKMNDGGLFVRLLGLHEGMDDELLGDMMERFVRTTEAFSEDYSRTLDL